MGFTNDDRIDEYMCRKCGENGDMIIYQFVIRFGFILVLKSADGGNILNSLWRISYTGHYEGAGAVFHYDRRKNSSCRGECLYATGPLTEPVELLVSTVGGHSKPVTLHPSITNGHAKCPISIMMS